MHHPLAWCGKTPRVVSCTGMNFLIRGTFGHQNLVGIQGSRQVYLQNSPNYIDPGQRSSDSGQCHKLQAVGQTGHHGVYLGRIRQKQPGGRRVLPQGFRFRTRFFKGANISKLGPSRANLSSWLTAESGLLLYSSRKGSDGKTKARSSRFESLE